MIALFINPFIGATVGLGWLLLNGGVILFITWLAYDYVERHKRMARERYKMELEERKRKQAEDITGKSCRNPYYKHKL